MFTEAELNLTRPQLFFLWQYPNFSFWETIFLKVPGSQHSDLRAVGQNQAINTGSQRATYNYTICSSDLSQRFSCLASAGNSFFVSFVFLSQWKLASTPYTHLWAADTMMRQDEKEQWPLCAAVHQSLYAAAKGCSPSQATGTPSVSPLGMHFSAVSNTS